MTWQKCPVCDGKGQYVDYSQNASPSGMQVGPGCVQWYTAQYPMITCFTCQGYGIIDEKTGLPPPSVHKVDNKITISKKRKGKK